MKTKFWAIVALFFFGFYFGASAQDVVGKWKTIDDETGKAKSVVEIYKGGNGNYFGKITKLFVEPGEDPDPICDVCTGSKKNQKVIGMIIISNMEKTGANMWKNGTILDPGNGKTYDCKMWVEDGKLQVRGYLGISALGRSQTWLKY